MKIFAPIFNYRLVFIATITYMLFAACNLSEENNMPDTDVEFNFNELSASVEKSPRPFAAELVWERDIHLTKYAKTSLLADQHGNLIIAVHTKGKIIPDSLTEINPERNVLIIRFNPDGELHNYFQLPEKGGRLFLSKTDRGVFLLGGDSETMRTYWIREDFVELISEFSVPEAFRKGRVNSIEIDNLGNIYMAGSKYTKIFYDYHIEESTPFIAKYTKYGKLLWEIVCNNLCIGTFTSISLDTTGDIWILGRYRDCELPDCFGIPPYKDEHKYMSFLIKTNSEAELLFKKVPYTKGDTTARVLQATSSGNIISHNGTSCLTHLSNISPPLRIYDHDFRLLWEQCLNDRETARLNLHVFHQSHQTVAMGHRRTGHRQPGESKDAFLNKQQIVFMRLDESGNHDFTKREYSTMRFHDITESYCGAFYVIGMPIGKVTLKLIKYR